MDDIFSVKLLNGGRGVGCVCGGGGKRTIDMPIYALKVQPRADL